MKNTKKALEEIKLHGYNLDFGTVFNHAFETYKKIALNAGAALILFALLVSIIAMGLIFGIFGLSTAMDQLDQFDIENFSTTWVMTYAFFMILISALGSPFHAGLLKMARNAAKSEEVSIGVSFEYYSSSYFKDIFLATLVLSGFTTIVSVGLEYVGYQILGTLINLSVSFLTFMTVPLIIFGNLKPMEAIQGSITIVSKQFLIILGLLIVTGLFCALGIFAFCIGIFFTLPLINAMTYSIYASAINDEDQEEPVQEDHEQDIIPE